MTVVVLCLWSLRNCLLFATGIIVGGIRCRIMRRLVALGFRAGSCPLVILSLSSLTRPGILSSALRCLLIVSYRSFASPVSAF